MNSDPIEQWYIDHHICFVCRRQDAEPHMQMCWECAEKHRARLRRKYYQNPSANIANSCQRRRERKAKRLEMGLCVECGKRPHDEGHKTCIYCRLRGNRKKRENERKRGALPFELRGNGFCFQCCKPINGESKLCAECLEKSRKTAANARTHIKLSNHTWRKEKAADIARIIYEREQRKK